MNDSEFDMQQLKTEQQYTLSKISHEIRNPVALIHSFLQLLVSKHPEIADYDYWDDIMDNMDYLIELLNELSVYNNSQRLQKKPVYLDAFLDKVAASVQPTLDYLGIQLQCRYRHPLPVLNIDELKLRQALLNLIRNSEEAIEGSGQILLEAKCEGSCLFLSISDNGSGIPEEYLPSLFDLFVTHKPNGTGLGLAITKSIVEAHNGSISVSSGEQGTTFTLRLPLEPQENF